VIALNAVQISVDPCEVRALALGDTMVRFIPIVFACPPKCHHRRQKAGWRLPSRETVLEVRTGHDRLWTCKPLYFFSRWRVDQAGNYGLAVEYLRIL
jgi:hypothetical protein